MTIRSNNEFGKLKAVVIGRASGANWPKDDPAFKTYWQYPVHTKGIKFPYTVPEELTNEIDEMLWNIIDVFNEMDIDVIRPTKVDWKRSTATYDYVTDGMSTLSIRDNLITIGNKVIECPSVFRSRHHEGDIAYHPIKNYVLENGGAYITAPRCDIPTTIMKVNNENKLQIDNDTPIFNGSDILKFGNRILYFISCRSNMKGAQWLQSVLGEEYTVQPTNRFFHYETLNNNIIPLDESTLLCNGDRLSAEAMPKEFKEYRKIWVNELRSSPSYKHEYGSKYMNMQILSIDAVTKIVNSDQPELVKLLEAHGFNVIQKNLTHTQTFGFGYHSMVTDLIRD